MFENLFDNLIVIIIILSLVTVFYCKATGQTLADVFIAVREFFSEPEEIYVQ